MIVQKLDKEVRVKLLKELADRINNMPDEEFIKGVRAYFVRQYYTMKDEELQKTYQGVFGKK